MIQRELVFHVDISSRTQSNRVNSSYPQNAAAGDSGRASSGISWDLGACKGARLLRNVAVHQIHT
jgi:hypothetical protein